jgi:hypothetical protein
MEHAIWIKKGGVEEYVHIKEIKAKLGENAARREKYKCPSKKCGVNMITVFPKQKKRNSEETHSDHFRASPEKHKPACEGDGERKAGVDNPGGDGTDTKPQHDEVRRGSYPVRYVKRARSRRGVIDVVVEGDGGEPEPPGPKEPRPKGVRDDSHTSEAETGHIRGIVEAYENPPQERSRMKLILPGCPARNYEDAFVDVDQVADVRELLRGHYIYKGGYGWHKSYPNDTIAIYFSRVFHGGRRRVGAWVEKTLGPDAKREEIKELLKRAERDREATLYMFGRFQPYRDWKYSIDIEAFGDLWITFPANSTTQS